MKNCIQSTHLACLFLTVASWAFASDSDPPHSWHSDYAAGRDFAKSNHKLLLVWFCNTTLSDLDSQLQVDVLNEATIAQSIAANYVAVQVAADTQSETDGFPGRLIDHEAFAELRGRPGLAIVDFSDESAPTYGRVVSIYPFSSGPITAKHLAVLLNLPPGTLTQRTLIFAIRTHRDGPASAAGDMHPLLAAEAAAHARQQANLNFQGHHNWNARFHAFNARLPAGHVSNEVCAESWPGQPLLDAARECVESWRSSSGHWGHVSRQCEYYGYDMQRGTNGVWYATGIFGRRR